MGKIVMTGGGSAGHVTPNIALFPALQKSGFEIHYIGSSNGIERELIEKEGIPYHPIDAGKLRRYLSVKNLSDALRVFKGFGEAFGVLRKLKPDVVFSKGGFVSTPVVWAAYLNRIPVVIHESDVTPGLANKLSIPFATKVCYTFPETKQYLHAEKSVLTGLPVRESLFAGKKEVGKKLCGFSTNKPVILVIGGSLGSKKINEVMRKALPELLKNFNICHLCGKGGLDNSLSNLQGYKQFEYVNTELQHLYSLADVIVSRAGATVLFEILALKKPALLIPLSKEASRGDQILNAQSFLKQGFSYTLLEEDLTVTSLVDNVAKVYQDKGVTKTLRQTTMGNGIENVLKVITEVKKS